MPLTLDKLKTHARAISATIDAAPRVSNLTCSAYEMREFCALIQKTEAPKDQTQEVDILLDAVMALRNRGMALEVRLAAAIESGLYLTKQRNEAQLALQNERDYHNYTKRHSEALRASSAEWETRASQLETTVTETKRLLAQEQSARSRAQQADPLWAPRLCAQNNEAQINTLRARRRARLTNRINQLQREMDALHDEFVAGDY